MCFLLFPLHTFCNLSKTSGSSHKWRFISWDNVSWSQCFVSVVGHSGRNTWWVFWVLLKIYLFFCFPLQTRLQGWGCVCTALPHFRNPGEVLEVVTLGSIRKVPKAAVLLKCCRSPAWSLDIGAVQGGAGNEPHC